MPKALLLNDDSATVFQLSSDTIAKLSYDRTDQDDANCSEVDISRLVVENTSIPVPRMRRVIKWDGQSVIIMDFIKGSTLAKVWPTYSLWMKIRVAFTLRRYVGQLRRLEAPLETPPGPLSKHAPKICDLPSIFGYIRSTRGPFSSYKELTDFFNRRYQLSGWENMSPEDQKATFDDSSPLVITHSDLNPRHIIAGEDGRLWVVDWAWAGYYPPWFEYAAMTNQVETERLEGWYDRSWELIVPFVCGPYFKQRQWLGRAGWGLYCK